MDDRLAVHTGRRDRHPGGVAEWETFLSTELPAYLADDFSVEPGGNAIVGLSMSGGPALTIALDHPEIFTVAQSLSGFYQTNNPVDGS